MREIAGDLIFLKFEFGPHDKVHDIEIDAVWPVVVQDLVVGAVLEDGVSRGYDGRPTESFMLDEVKNRSICSLQVVHKLHIAFQVAWRTLKKVDAFDSYRRISIGQWAVLSAYRRARTDQFFDLAPRGSSVVFLSSA